MLPIEVVNPKLLNSGSVLLVTTTAPSAAGGVMIANSDRASRKGQTPREGRNFILLVGILKDRNGGRGGCGLDTLFLVKNYVQTSITIYALQILHVFLYTQQSRN